MNGLSQVLDQFVTTNYSSFLVSNQLSSETIVSSERQLAFETIDSYSNKALEETTDTTHPIQPIVYTTSQNFDNGIYSGLTNDSDNCLNAYFCDSQLTHDWNQFNESLICENNLNSEPLVVTNDLNQTFNNFETHFETNNELKNNLNEISLKQISKKTNNKTNNKRLSRKESQLSVRPPKPVSAYALFFRDAQSLIKSSNPSASFGEISKVVASNWEALDKKDKNVYKERADYQKKNYLKTLASSRAKQIAGLMANTTAKLGLNSIASNETNNQNRNQTMNSDQTSNETSSGGVSGINMNHSDNNSDQLHQNIISTSEETSAGVPKQHCIRNGCENDAIDSSEWDSEYCSSECCVKHCADVFQAWVQKQQFSQN